MSEIEADVRARLALRERDDLRAQIVARDAELAKEREHRDTILRQAIDWLDGLVIGTLPTYAKDHCVALLRKYAKEPVKPWLYEALEKMEQVEKERDEARERVETWIAIDRKRDQEVKDLLAENRKERERGDRLEAQAAVMREAIRHLEECDDSIVIEKCEHGKELFAALASDAGAALLRERDQLQAAYDIARQMANCVYNANQDPAQWERAKRVLVELLPQFDAARRGQ